MITTAVVAMTTVWRSDELTPDPLATGRSPEHEPIKPLRQSRHLRQTNKSILSSQTTSAAKQFAPLPGWRFLTLNAAHLTQSISSSQHDKP